MIRTRAFRLRARVLFYRRDAEFAEIFFHRRDAEFAEVFHRQGAKGAKFLQNTILDLVYPPHLAHPNHIFSLLNGVF
ncbi:MAG TPA: hypothetical protein VFO52_12550 [Longimicrobiales bacterium]|nr:hypothetical protein [Longimicrobiales bacterium]